MMTLAEILNQCARTGAWGGTKIVSLDQRNDLGDTPLHTVCSWGDVDAVKVLVAAGADVNAVGDGGATPLVNAIIGGNPNVVEFLLSQGADRRVKVFGTTTLVEYAKNVGANAKVIRLLDAKRK